MATVNITGIMVNYMTENGLIIKCMDKVSSLGQMVANTMEQCSTIRGMATEYLIGPMAEFTMAFGSMENKKALEFTQINKAELSTEHGKKERDKSGFRRMNSIN